MISVKTRVQVNLTGLVGTVLAIRILFAET